MCLSKNYETISRWMIWIFSIKTNKQKNPKRIGSWVIFLFFFLGGGGEGYNSFRDFLGSVWIFFLFYLMFFGISTMNRWWLGGAGSCWDKVVLFNERGGR